MINVTQGFGSVLENAFTTSLPAFTLAYYTLCCFVRPRRRLAAILVGSLSPLIYVLIALYMLSSILLD